MLCHALPGCADFALETTVCTSTVIVARFQTANLRFPALPACLALPCAMMCAIVEQSGQSSNLDAEVLSTMRIPSVHCGINTQQALCKKLWCVGYMGHHNLDGSHCN